MLLEFRIALTAENYDEVVRFYHKGIGLEQVAEWNNEFGRGVVLKIENATLEILEPSQAEAVDQIEVGARVSGQIRFALQVPDLAEASQTLQVEGAQVVHAPVMTPWNDLNQRLQAPDGLQITLFQAPSSE